MYLNIHQSMAHAISHIDDGSAKQHTFIAVFQNFHLYFIFLKRNNSTLDLELETEYFPNTEEECWKFSLTTFL